MQHNINNKIPTLSNTLNTECKLVNAKTQKSALSCLKYYVYQCTITYQLLAVGMCSCHAIWKRNIFSLKTKFGSGTIMTFAFCSKNGLHCKLLQMMPFGTYVIICISFEQLSKQKFHFLIAFFFLWIIIWVRRLYWK